MLYKFTNDLPDDILVKGDLAIDTETMGLNLKRDRLCLLQINNGKHTYLIKFQDKEYNAPNLKKLLSDPEPVKIMHYARFDMAAIKHYLGVDLQNVFCTKIASKIARTYTDNHGLKTICGELLSVGISKHQQSSYWGAKNLSKEQEEYAANDVLYLHQIKDKLIGILKNEDRFELVQKICDFLPTRVELDLRGWEDDIFAH